jgi:glycosyltransferase involved in cell wall biosynthesis
MKSVRLLVISHSCIEEVNRAVYRLLATRHNIELHLVIPSRIHVCAEVRTCSAAPDEPFTVTSLEPSGSHMRLQRFKGLSSLIRRIRPSHILVEADAASLLMRDVVRAAKAVSAQVWSITAENLERRYLGESWKGLRSGRPSAAIGGLMSWWLWKSSRRDIAQVFVLSEDGLRAMSRLGFAGRVTKIPLGFDPELFRPQGSQDIAATRRRLGLRSKTIAYFGRLTPEKGVALLLEALGMLKDLEWQLLIDEFSTYRTEYALKLQSQVETLRLSDRVVYFDASHSEMPNYMNAADVVVLPSVSTPKWKEQYGRVIPESMACGKVVVGSDSGTIPELIADAGFTFPEGDARRLAELLRYILTASDTELEPFKTRAAQRALGKLSIIPQAAIWSEMLRDDGRRATGDGREATDDGRETTDDGRETTGDGRRKTDAGRPTTDDGRRALSGLRSAFPSLPSSVPGLRSPVPGRRSSLRVLHIIPSVSPQDGGPSFAMPLIARGLELSGVQVDVATTEGAHEQRIDQNEGSVFYFRRQSEFYKVSLPLSKWLSAHIRDYDLVHIHALFSYSSYAAARLATKNGVPYIVRPLGVLNRWGMQNRRKLLKRLSFRFIEQRIMRNAAAIHYTSQQERLEAEETGVRNESVVIPLAVDLSGFRELPGPEPFYEKFPHARGRDIILFLSRLDPKKGLDLLLRAFATHDRRRTTEEGRLMTDDGRPATDDRGPSSVVGRLRPLLIIAGEGEDQFVAGLRRLAGELGIADEILWTGFLGGDDKLSAMAAASLFVLPSYSENFGIALVEAMAAGLACVMSDQVGIAVDAKEYDAGLVVPCEVGPLASAMQRLLDDPELRGRLGANARRLVDDRFSVEAMSDSLVKLYDRVLSGRAEADTTRVSAIG